MEFGAVGIFSISDNPFIWDESTEEWKWKWILLV